MTTIPQDKFPSSEKTRVRVFVDYWNVQLSLNSKEAKARGLDFRFKIDWRSFGAWLAKKACQVSGIGDAHYIYDGVIIYTSFNPNTSEGKGFHKWATTWLNRQPGVRVECFARKPKGYQKCPLCYEEIALCPHCNQQMKGTIEKGVDTLIATDMIRLAWEQAYDMAVLATSDSDLVPAVQFLHLKGIKVVQAGFPPIGTDLATTCWASFDIYKDRKEIERIS
ncbi:MAG: NYN domain-containing protein [Nitrospira sp.]|nr:NYN domain-containing protein [Nitrospira sp.]